MTDEGRHFDGSSEGHDNGIEVFEAFGLPEEEAIAKLDVLPSQRRIARVLARRARAGGGIVTREEIDEIVGGDLSWLESADAEGLTRFFATLGLRFEAPLAEALEEDRMRSW